MKAVNVAHMELIQPEFGEMKQVANWIAAEAGQAARTLRRMALRASVSIR